MKLKSSSLKETQHICGYIWWAVLYLYNANATVGTQSTLQSQWQWRESIRIHTQVPSAGGNLRFIVLLKDAAVCGPGPNRYPLLSHGRLYLVVVWEKNWKQQKVYMSVSLGTERSKVWLVRNGLHFMVERNLRRLNANVLFIDVI